MIQITIDKLNCPSWNDMQRFHWSARRRHMLMVKQLTIAAVRKQIKKKVSLPRPCPVTVSAHFNGSVRRDCDNLYVKPIMDGLVFCKLLKDDNCDELCPLTFQAYTHQEEDKIIITMGV